MDPILFAGLYFTGLFVASGIRWHYTREYRETIRKEGKRQKADTPLVYLPALGMFVFPVVYVFSSFLSAADYVLPAWAGGAGMLVYGAALWLLWRSHADLGGNFSPVTEIREGHRLVTSGVYSRIRHPIYAAHFLWGLAQPLLLWNWIAGFSMIATMIPLYLARVGPEEQMMIDRFGDEYRKYMKSTGRLVPRLWQYS
jgi:protein-S-isoprenylcysteine O-methyltransferase Ste14